jgi:replicative DNA helicase
MGGSGVGKTALALQIASECECPSLYLTCEMTALELLRRSAARVTRTYLGKFKDGTLTGAIVKEKARKAAEGSPDLAIADATKALASDQWIHTVAKAHKAGSPHYLVVIDSLHSWAEGITTGQQDYELISAACRSLRILAANLECPVIAIAEKNRASMGKSTSKEVVSAGAGSRKIEYGSESVIHLEAKAFDKATGETPIKLMFAKNRNGAAGEDIDLIFEGGFQNYREA